jgi:hypothetical protein
MCPVLRTVSTVLYFVIATLLLLLPLPLAGLPGRRWPMRETPTVKAPTNAAGGPETPFTLYTGPLLLAWNRLRPIQLRAGSAWMAWIAISQPTQVQYLQYPT